MLIFDRTKTKNFINGRPIATSFMVGSMLLFAGMPMVAGASALFIGTGLANATIKFLVKKISIIVYGEWLPPNTFRFNDKDDKDDKDDNVLFAFNENVPGKNIVIKIPESGGHETEYYRVNSTLIELYFLFYIFCIERQYCILTDRKLI